MAGNMTEKAADNDDQLDAALLDFMKLRDSGQPIDRQAFLATHPHLADSLRELLEAADCIELMAGPTEEEASSPTPPSRHRPSHDDSTLPGTLRAPGLRNDSMRQDNVRFDNMRSDNMRGDNLRQDNVNDVTLDPRRGNGVGEISFASLPEIDGTQPNLPCRFGDYILERVIGRGGMGVVYQARQVHLDRQVAIKMIRSGALASEEEVARFYAEARSAAKLDHPNIVTVYQCGEYDGHHYFSMDFIRGTDLATKLDEGPLPPREAAKHVSDVAKAIAYAHQQGVLHRDLKPANVLIDESETVVVTDFGLAKLIGTETGLTATGATMGTPSYMSPEQAGGNSDDHNAGTDIYSLGAILFALLSGKPPFGSETVIQTIMQVMHKPAPMLRQIRAEVHVDLETIVAKCLQKQPAKRYLSAEALAEDLDRYLSGEPIQARPMTKWMRTVHWVHGIPLVAALTGHRVVDPTPSHRWAQRLIVLSMLLIPLIYVTSRYSWIWYREHSLPSVINIGAGMPGGMYQSVASQLANRLETATGKHPIVMTTEGSDDNLSKLLGGQVDLAILQTSSVKGYQVAVVAPLYHEAFHLLVRQESKDMTIESLRGKRVAMGLAHSGTRQATRSILRHYQMKEDDFQIVEADYVSIDHTSDIDAIFAMIKPGASAIRNLLASGRWRLCPLNEALDITNDEPTFRVIQVNQADYPAAGMAASISTVATTAFLATRSNASPRLVETALQSLYEGEPIAGILPAFRAAQWKGLPWHRSARQFFDRLETLN